jgi:hypothetical protein
MISPAFLKSRNGINYVAGALVLVMVMTLLVNGCTIGLPGHAPPVSCERYPGMDYPMNPPLARDSLTIDDCSITVERGKQHHLNITYRYLADKGPDPVQFNSTPTQLDLVFDPPAFSVEPHTDFQSVVIINASPSLAPGVYRFGIQIDGIQLGIHHCKTGGPADDYGKREIVVNVV